MAREYTRKVRSNMKAVLIIIKSTEREFTRMKRTRSNMMVSTKMTINMVKEFIKTTSRKKNVMVLKYG